MQRSILSPLINLQATRDFSLRLEISSLPQREVAGGGQRGIDLFGAVVEVG